jgi:C-terminal processing protease CtpA/Prc
MVEVLELKPYNPDCIVEEPSSLIALPGDTPEAEKETPEAEKEEAKPAETAPGPGTTLEFDAGGTQISVLITSVPLGIVFKTEAPLMVKRVEPGSSAEKAGVKPDWIFKSIGGKSLDGLSYADAVELLKAELAPLPTVEREQTGQWSLEIEFLTGSGSKKIFFPYQPLGLTFERKVPIVVQTVTPGSLAETLGVQIGWTVKAIGGVQCDGEAYEVQLQRFKSGAKELPEYQLNK